MFYSDKLIFIELPKTGCSHIRRLLSEIVGGTLEGKHNYPPTEFLEGSVPFVGSIRNPWELYVSMWAFGCDHKGGLYERATKPRCIGIKNFFDLRKIYYQTTSPHCRWGFNARKKLRHIPTLFMNEVARKPDGWKSLYTFADDPEGFRRWLHRIHDPAYRYDFGEGYGFSAIHGFAGLLTYRYLSLFCRNNKQLFSKKSLPNYESLRAFEKENLYISHFIRNEKLEEDLIDALNACNVEVSEGQEELIFKAQKTNTSSKSHGVEYYYDRETVELVKVREKLIIERFGYPPPLLAHS